ncbi:TPA: hypothetical protein ACFB87_000588 [Neisseria gonorrhoeae]|uniref:hypothetical protein n=1 Tax=Neisseria gonorrhoeae TaxID=485 RepID=UPI001E45190F|nr:hypothetical protein [Neisseria gonorrhoeae]MCC9029210.1 hypothetical protein [Neisseria gonorrhoeae]MCC9040349.1 hypothetical protein [Neisseria gonorrhoeae]MCF2983142.1 hypothetical protein [Neisseria gonorrhoeae]MCF3048684.1 hypothetical protein [Neisseria gonorrhoeae]MCF3063980.1 hypothetical protein [Neisseria gonorrhoeae]
MLKNEIRGGLGIPPDWATMRGQAKKKKRMSLPMRKKEFSGGKKGSYNIRLSVSHQFG